MALFRADSLQPIERYRQLAGTEAIRRGFSLTLAQSAISHMLMYLVFGSLLIGASGAIRVIEMHHNNQALALWWTCCASVIGTSLYIMIRQTSYVRAARWGLLTAFALLGWWASFFQFGVFTDGATVIVGSLLVMSFTAIPWPTQCHTALTAGLVGIMWWLWGLNSCSLPLLTIWLMMLIAFVRLSSRCRVSFVAHLSLDYLARYCESASAEALPTIRLLASQLLALVEEQRALLTFTSGRLEVIGSQSVEHEFVDSMYPRALEQMIVDQRSEQGLVRTRDIGDQLSGRLKDWLGAVPAYVFFIRIITVVDSREERLCIFIPVGPNARISGLQSVFRALLGVCAVARVYLSAARNRFISSDVLLVSQQSASEKEEELNQLIHLVNNVAQDISVQCEEIRQKLGQESQAPSTQAFFNGLQDLEAASRSLSVGVSDVKLLNELLHVSKFKREEVVDVKAVLDDLELYCSYRARRRGDSFKVVRSDLSGIAVKSASRELFETALRALVLEASRIDTGKVQHARVELQVLLDEKRVTIRLSGNGAPISVSMVELLKPRLSEHTRFDRRTVQLQSIANFVIESGGVFELWTPPDGSPFGVQLTLMRQERRTSNRGMANQWALLVDDNTQVTGFYGRVAQALEFRYFTAASLHEAREVIEREGQPHLVVTDIQLGDGSGLDFVRYLRGRFGDSLPIIVVSGNTQEDTRIQAAAAGATKFLAKPIGRARLFGEIESLTQTII